MLTAVKVCLQVRWLFRLALNSSFHSMKLLGILFVNFGIFVAAFNPGRIKWRLDGTAWSVHRRLIGSGVNFCGTFLCMIFFFGS